MHCGLYVHWSVEFTGLLPLLISTHHWTLHTLDKGSLFFSCLSCSLADKYKPVNFSYFREGIETSRFCCSHSSCLLILIAYYSFFLAWFSLFLWFASCGVSIPFVVQWFSHFINIPSMCHVTSDWFQGQGNMWNRSYIATHGPFALWNLSSYPDISFFCTFLLLSTSSFIGSGIHMAAVLRLSAY